MNLEKFHLRKQEIHLLSIIRPKSSPKKTLLMWKNLPFILLKRLASPIEDLWLSYKEKISLPHHVYEHMRKYCLPKYEWNIIDAKTRIRFTAYSYERNSTFGFSFILFVVLWLRVHNVRHKINIRLDNGEEFCSGSERKLREWNELLSFLNVELKPIPPGAKHLMGIIENSHRQDDEYFLGIHAERCRNEAEFLMKAQRWQDTWNIAKPSFGIGMEGKTPYEKLKSTMFLVHPHVLEFPVILLEDLLSLYGLFTKNLSIFLKGSNYVHIKCP